MLIDDLDAALARSDRRHAAEGLLTLRRLLREHPRGGASPGGLIAPARQVGTAPAHLTSVKAQGRRLPQPGMSPSSHIRAAIRAGLEDWIMTADAISPESAPSSTASDTSLGFKSKVLSILDDHRWMAVATCRPDGWPQATMVGYVHDDLAIYFVISRNSQKFANIERDPRISIAIGGGPDKQVIGLSMAARAFEVRDLDEVQRLNVLLAETYPNQSLFAPRDATGAVMRAVPKLVSLIDDAEGVQPPALLHVSNETVVRPA